MTPTEQQYLWHRERMRTAIANIIRVKDIKIDWTDPWDVHNRETDLRAYKAKAIRELRRMNRLKPGVGFDVLARRPRDEAIAARAGKRKEARAA